MGRAQVGETWPLNLSRVNDELDAAINDAAVRAVLRYAKRDKLSDAEIGDCCAKLGLDRVAMMINTVAAWVVSKEPHDDMITEVCDFLKLNRAAVLERASALPPAAVERLEPSGAGDYTPGAF